MFLLLRKDKKWAAEAKLDPSASHTVLCLLTLSPTAVHPVQSTQQVCWMLILASSERCFAQNEDCEFCFCIRAVLGGDLLAASMDRRNSYSDQ